MECVIPKGSKCGLHLLIDPIVKGISFRLIVISVAGSAAFELVEISFQFFGELYPFSPAL